jgi:hypothetical protein
MCEKIDRAEDRVVIRTGRGPGAIPLFSVVIWDSASRCDLLVDQVDDVQLAVEALLMEEPLGEDTLALEVRPAERGISLCLRHLTNPGVKAALLALQPFQPCEECLLDVRILLESLVDGFSVEETDDGSFAVRMDKWA